MSNEQLQKVLLIIAGIGLIPIALVCGIVPERTIAPLCGFSVDNVNLTHILRAIMGLYFAQSLIWLLGAFYTTLRRPALYCLVVFMLGLAAGRMLSIILDGRPHALLIVYLLLEISIGVAGLILLRQK